MSILLRGKKSLSQLARAILRSFGPDASRYPFATLQGMFQDSAGTVPAMVATDPIGKATDAIGTHHATQTTAIDRPTVQQDGNGRYYASFNGTNSSLPLASTLTAVAGTFIGCARADVLHWGTLVGNGGNSVSEPGISLGTASNGTLRAVFGNGTIANLVVSAGDTYTPGEIFVVSVQWDMSFIKVRKNSGTAGQVANLLGDLTSATLGSIGRIGPLGGDYFSGGIYDAIAIKGVVSASQLLTLEKAVGQRGGLVL